MKVLLINGSPNAKGCTYTALSEVAGALNKEGIYPRRYFYPSLNKLPYLKNYKSCSVSEDVCSRIACLPLYPMLDLDDISRICQIIKEVLNA